MVGGRVVVVGGGVVGCAVARALALRGLPVVLLESRAALAGAVSSGNSGIICTGYDAAPIERACLKTSMQLRPTHFRQLGLSTKPTGALVVAWSSADVTRLDGIVAANDALGDSNARLLSRDGTKQARKSELPACDFHSSFFSVFVLAAWLDRIVGSGTGPVAKGPWSCLGTRRGSSGLLAGGRALRPACSAARCRYQGSGVG